ncbi:hypothetical protein B0T10DRAFT_575348 [Thelonectria olida]|uniref:NACHT domain-containing protein n=1 Tax=Thelonectria olida TaxID=1576542 RepID=A0A9P8W1Y3_9HYPO|nr:hypothetical protein B0T10DRAFT_575348 [Thelonectria olida]
MAEFGLAASILQVIDFSTKFALTAYDIYTSSAKAANGLEGLQAQSKDLEVVLSKLQTESEQFVAPSHNGGNDGIVVLAEKSAASLKKMLETLSKVKRPPKGRFRWLLIEYLTRGIDQQSAEIGKEQLQKALVNLLYAKPDEIEKDPQIQLSDSHRQRLEVIFLARLQYLDMDDRDLAIQEAHEKTFQWIFDDSQHQATRWSSLTDWLESNQQLYWITGKAGAGKSTLMKFLTCRGPVEQLEPGKNRTMPHVAAKENRCTKYLEKWAGDKPLIVASFYFWAAGSAAQKSQTGLFRTLLFQLPKLALKPFHLHLHGDGRKFSERELRRMFNRAVVHLSLENKVVLFVDGLDEFDGDLEPLLSIMKSVVSESSVKLCVASRPWVEFQEALKDEPSLRLENLTYFDIKRYVEAKFNVDRNLPSYVAEMLRLPTSSSKPLSPRHRACSYGFELLSTLSFRELAKAIMNLRLNSRCKGLLEIQEVSQLDQSLPSVFEYPGPKIQYLHRTVRDFIDGPEAVRILDRHLPPAFDPNLRLLEAALAMHKACNRHRTEDREGRMISDCMYYAARAHLQHEHETVKLLTAAHQTMDHLSSHCQSFLEPEGIGRAMSDDDMFLCMTIRFGVVQYARAKIKANCLIQLERDSLKQLNLTESGHDSRRARSWATSKRVLKSLYSDTAKVSYPLLLVPFLAGDMPSRGTFSYSSRVAMVDTLLDYGADPNYRFTFQSGGDGAVVDPTTTKKSIMLRTASLADYQNQGSHIRQGDPEAIANSVYSALKHMVGNKTATKLHINEPFCLLKDISVTPYDADIASGQGNRATFNMESLD